MSQDQYLQIIRDIDRQTRTAVRMVICSAAIFSVVLAVVSLHYPF